MESPYLKPKTFLTLPLTLYVNGPSGTKGESTLLAYQLKV